MTGLFVVFEGGDSAGKTTQSELLCGWLKARGRAFVATRQPGGTEVGSHLRRLVLDPSFGDVSPRAEALMYAADKAQHGGVEVGAPSCSCSRVRQSQLRETGVLL